VLKLPNNELWLILFIAVGSILLARTGQLPEVLEYGRETAD